MIRLIACTEEELITTDLPSPDDGDPIIRRWNPDTFEFIA
jgi:hypothetical protein